MTTTDQHPPPQSDGSPRLVPWAVVLGLTAVAALLRFLDVAARPLVGTETNSFLAAQFGVLELFTPPPPYGLFMIPLTYAMQSVVLEVLPTALGLRLPGLLCGVAAVPVLYVVGRRWFGQRAALLACALLTFAPMHVFQSQLAKFYPCMVLLGLGTLWCLQRLLKRGDVWSIAGLALLSLLSLYNQFYTALLIASNIAWALVVIARQPPLRRRVLTGLGVSTGVVVLGYLPYLPIFFRTVVNNDGVGIGRWATPRLYADLDFALELLGLYGPGPGPAVWLFAALLVVGLAVTAARKRPEALLLLTHVGLPLGGAFALRTRDAFDAEHLMFTVPMLLLFAGAGGTWLAERAGDLLRRPRPVVPALTALIAIAWAVACSPALWGYYGLHTLRTYRSMAHLQLSELALADGEDGAVLYHLPNAERFLDTWIIDGGDLIQDPTRHWLDVHARRNKALERVLPKHAELEVLATWTIDAATRAELEDQPISPRERAAFLHWARRDLDAERGSLRALIRRIGELGSPGGPRAEALLDEALELMYDGRASAALPLLRDAVDAAPGRPELQVALGLALAEAGQPVEARDSLLAGIATMEAMYAYAPQKVDGMSSNYRETASPYRDTAVGYDYDRD